MKINLKPTHQKGLVKKYKTRRKLMIQNLMIQKSMNMTFSHW